MVFPNLNSHIASFSKLAPNPFHLSFSNQAIARMLAKQFTVRSADQLKVREFCRDTNRRARTHMHACVHACTHLRARPADGALDWCFLDFLTKDSVNYANELLTLQEHQYIKDDIWFLFSLSVLRVSVINV